MTHTMIDCQGLVGAWTLGGVQAGLELVHRVSLGAFGDEIVESNRHLLGHNWTQDTGVDSSQWEPKQAAVMIGTPPCSGFSLLNRSKKENARGPRSAINHCMWELVKYAGKCTGEDGERGPEIVSFESVQGAGKLGRDLMRMLRDELDSLTGQSYSLTHVFCSGATVGAAQMRHRYYFVLHRIPFGVRTPERRRVATYIDAIGDLVGLEQTWDAQNVIADDERDWWLREQGIVPNLGTGSTRTVDAHISLDKGRDIEVLLRDLVPYWPAGKDLAFAMRAHRDATGDFPEVARKWWNYEMDEMRGFHHPTRIHPDKSGYVLTGGCVEAFIHWSEPRMLSVRECARLMGFPDDWSFDVCSTVKKAGMYIGKCCPVNTGKWIAEEFVNALDGHAAPSSELVGDREYEHNSTLLYKPWLREQRGW